MTKTNTATMTSILSNALITSAKGKSIQRALKAADFSKPENYANYTRLCNLFISSLAEHVNGETEISKKALTGALQGIFDHLSIFEGLTDIQAASYHTRFIIGHACNLLITDSGVMDIIRSERAIKRLIELCAYFELNALPVPAVTLTEKAQKRMEKNAEKCGEMARKAAEKVRKEGERAEKKAKTETEKPKKAKKAKKAKKEVAA